MGQSWMSRVLSSSASPLLFVAVLAACSSFAPVDASCPRTVSTTLSPIDVILNSLTQFNGLAVDPINNEYILSIDQSNLGAPLVEIVKGSPGLPWADQSSYTINGVITNVANTGEDGVALSDIRTTSPLGLALSWDGLSLCVANANERVVHVATRANHSVSWADALTTRFGTGSSGASDGSRTTSSFGQPSDCEFVPDGLSIIVTDAGNTNVRVISRSTLATTWDLGVVNTMPFTNLGAETAGVAVDVDGLTAFFTDLTNGIVYMVQRPNASDPTWALVPSKTQLLTGLNSPRDVDVSPNGLYIAVANQGNCKVTLLSRPNISFPWSDVNTGTAETIGSTCATLGVTVDGDAASAQFNPIWGVEFLDNQKCDMSLVAAERYLITPTLTSLRHVSGVCCDCATNCTGNLSNTPSNTPSNSTNQSHAASQSQTGCQAGYQNFSSSCVPCPVGQYNNVPGGSCKACPAGTYGNGTGAKSVTDCVACPSNSVSLAGSIGFGNCSCIQGFTGPEHGMCVACPAGSYKSAVGSTSCQLCPFGKYSTHSGKSVCQTCPSGTHAPAGSVSLNSCLGRCSGLQILPGTEGIVTFKASHLQKCRWLLLPGWGYVSQSLDHWDVSQPSGCQNSSTSRRLLSLQRTTREPDNSPSTVRSIQARVPSLNITCGTSANASEVPFVVFITTANATNGTSNVRCQGTLIDSRWVVTAAHCVIHKGQILSNLTATIGYHKATVGVNQGDSSCEIERFAVSRVFVHPGFSVNQSYDVALLELSELSRFRPVRMYSGEDLTSKQCGAPDELRYTEVGWTQDNAEAGKRLVQNTMYPTALNSCANKYSEVNNTIGSENLCATAQQIESQSPCFCSSGSPLLVDHPTKKGEYLLIAVSSWGENCEARGLPGVYVRISTVHQWILSVTKLGEFGPMRLHLTFSHSSLPHGATFKVYSRGVEHESLLRETLNSSNSNTSGSANTSATAVTWKDDGTGSLLATLHTDSSEAAVALDALGELQLKYKWLTCSENFEAEPLKTAESCTKHGMQECRFEELGGQGSCLDPECSAPDSDSIISSIAEEKAYMGGLGTLRSITGTKTYKSWMCLRDWSREAQRKCAIRPGELACFRYDSRSESWDYHARNEEVNFVSNLEETAGKESENSRALLLP